MSTMRTPMGTHVGGAISRDKRVAWPRTLEKDNQRKVLDKPLPSQHGPSSQAYALHCRLPPVPALGAPPTPVCMCYGQLCERPHEDLQRASSMAAATRHYRDFDPSIRREYLRKPRLRRPYPTAPRPMRTESILARQSGRS